MRKQAGSRSRGWLPTIGNRLSVAAGVALAAGLLAAFAPRAEATRATGGTVTNYTDAGGTNWTAHIFTNTAATSIVFSVGGNVDVLVVGGGGAGRGIGTGGNTGSGGSAGQLVYIENYSVSASSYPIIVGLGGPGVVNAIGSSGSNSVFGSLSVLGSYIQALGGAGGINIDSGASADGGDGAGGAGVKVGAGGAGGPGLTNYISGSGVAYAGGGGGGNTTVHNGGVGGGGRGENYGVGDATAGTDGLGGGGGGVCRGDGPNAGKNGGSGIVIVRYTTPSVSVTPINSFFVNGTTPISATATVYGDSPPFTVKFYTNSASGSYAQAGTDQGPATGPSFSVAMTGFPDNSTNHIYAVVVDSAGKTNTSTINTFFMVPNNQPISPYKAFCVGDVPSIFTNDVGTSSQKVYAVHKYTNTAVTGYFVPSTSIKNIEVLLVGGGGGGGYQLGGGGGAGGLVWTSSTVTAQSYPVVVGNRGAGGTSTSAAGKGSNSTFNLFFAYGGGGGCGTANANSPATAGSSGGGGGGDMTNGGTTNGAAGIYIGQGNAGGHGTHANGYNAGGGGGAGATGGNGVNGTSGKGGDGGNGITNSITGTATVYAGGGGGGAYNSPRTIGLGGSGGGGDGGLGAIGSAGTDGLGGGGGGGGSAKNGGAGGSGVVIIRYDISPPKGTVFMMR